MSKYIGSDFDDFLKEEGLLEELETSAIEEIRASRFGEHIKQQKLALAKAAWPKFAK